MDKRTKRLAIGTVIAAAAGYIAGILTAPKSGKETRHDIKEVAERTYTTAEKELKLLHTELNQLLDQARSHGAELSGSAKENLDKAMSTAKTAKEKTRELLSAVHEGGADDKDLEKAIKEGRKALDHLKTFVAKKPAAKKK
ncbi:MAG TPA: YtxH domain-containing protein [Candidatus Saccharimonadales bacterium]|nr:YtxH domain-containing protein [Candidatus Saccharimonadales bacterium]